MVRVIKSPYLNTPQLLDVDRSKVHPLVRNLFLVKARQTPLAGRLKFLEKATQDMSILSIVQGFKIPFSQTPLQFGPPQLARVNQEERLQINSEIKEILRKGAIQQVKSDPGKFLSNLFLVNKRDGGHRPVINLKFLNSFIPYQHFKMEGMPQEKVLDIQNKCAQLIVSPKTTIMELTKLLGKLSLIAQAVVPGRI